ncbi:Uncharacterised protein [BD1-7 clade bacterium]|uniref:Multidrug resistance protein MdtA-like C-terminal permuted SH3 domain-containing protein n=1 Tax=BD1-7 clade bacterium TaxID=2029982 RepID=A0A5S9N5K7_9GAMM|nr:Uncharacterised protein [BD1-7 clade bacterium]CAA0085115.1 Uncharacterised protein [BD1-7 clade bacterium]
MTQRTRQPENIINASQIAYPLWQWLLVALVILATAAGSYASFPVSAETPPQQRSNSALPVTTVTSDGPTNNIQWQTQGQWVVPEHGNAYVTIAFTQKQLALLAGISSAQLDISQSLNTQSNSKPNSAPPSLTIALTPAWPPTGNRQSPILHLHLAVSATDTDTGTTSALGDAHSHDISSALVSGQSVTVQIQGKLRQPLTPIPYAYLRANSSVWLVDNNNSLIIRPITIAYADGNALYLRDGIHAGDKIIVSDLPFASAGLSVAPTERPVTR